MKTTWKLLLLCALPLLLTLPAAAFAQEPTAPALPGTPAGRMAEAYLKARNTGRIAAVQEFQAKYDARPVRDDFNDPEVRQKVQTLFDLFGEFTVQRVVEAKPLELRALLKASKGKWLSLWVQVEEGAPDKLTGLRIELTAAPTTAKDK